VHFTTGNYHRTQSLLARGNGNLAERNPQCRYLNAHCSIKLSKIDEALQLLGESNPTHLIAVPGNGNSRQKLRHVDTHSRAGARHHNKATRNERLPTSEERDREDVDNIKSEAAMCYLRGVCYAKQNSFDRAKECYKVAVQIDVLCFEAFDALMANSLLSPEEEWAFLETPSTRLGAPPPPRNSPTSQETSISPASPSTRNQKNPPMQPRRSAHTTTLQIIQISSAPKQTSCSPSAASRKPSS
jgi:tetratricopeptide (TPR) repeat protein